MRWKQREEGAGADRLQCCAQEVLDREAAIFLSGWQSRRRIARLTGGGKGFHGYQMFSGYLLKAILQQHIPATSEIMKTAYFVLIGADGYRIALAYSELCNRNDQAEFLLIDQGQEQDGGRYSVFPSADFFSDRAIKAVQEIHILKLGE